MRIVACYITENNENTIGKSLESIRTQIDDVFAVDMGSADHTREVLTRYGVKVINFIEGQEIDARNMLIERVDADWIIFLDANEYFTTATAANLRQTIRRHEAVDSKGILITSRADYCESARKIIKKNYALRIYRKQPGMHYISEDKVLLYTAHGHEIQPMTLANPKDLLLDHINRVSMQMVGKEKIYEAIPTKLLKAMEHYWDIRDIGHANEIADKILRLSRADESGLVRVLIFFLSVQDAKGAEKTLQYLLANFPLTAYYLSIRGEIAKLELDYDRAIPLLEMTLEWGVDDPNQRADIYNLLAGMQVQLGIPEEAAKNYLIASRMYRDYKNVYVNYENYLMCCHYRVMDSKVLFDEICEYQKFFSQIIPYEHQRKSRREKLRIGYISADLRVHVVAFFCYVMFKNYDRACFEVYCYANNPEDVVSKDIARSVDHWCNIQFMSAKAIAKQVHDDEIDIFVDLGGHTAGNCLPVMAYKPAPIQVSGIGWFNTTGLKTVDYFIADIYTDPIGQNNSYFTEKLLRLPHTHFCYMWHGWEIWDETVPWEKAGYITFGCMNNFSKVTDEMLVVWARIMAAVPKSRLLLKAIAFDFSYGCRRAAERMQKAGISLARVDMEHTSSDYLKSYQKIDIAFDTYPYPGGGTTCDALYMGVPVITLVGKRHGARFGYSLLMNMGLEELCATSPEQYADRAISLAKNRNRIADLHLTLRRRMRQSVIMDTGLYMSELEQAYQRIWQEWLYHDDDIRKQEETSKKEIRMKEAI